jgi:hypothetical protein
MGDSLFNELDPAGTEATDPPDQKLLSRFPVKLRFHY